ncbi:MAG: hypothetical protein V8R91_02235 [Butyricimonas faecihominis]
MALSLNREAYNAIPPGVYTVVLATMNSRRVLQLGGIFKPQTTT